MMKMLTNALTVAIIVVMTWGFLSWGEICCKNLNENPQYSDYNIIINLTEWANENIEQH